MCKYRAAVLAVAQFYFVSSSFFTVMWLLTEADYERSFSITFYGPIAGGFLVLSVFGPLAGWLADVHYGQYKVMRLGLCVMWIGGVLGVLWLLLFPKLCTEEHTCLEVQRYLGAIWFVVLFTGSALYIINAAQFGVDQLPEASADELSSLIRWFVWALYAGEFTARMVHLIRYCVPAFTADRRYIAGAVQSMVPVTMISLSLICNYLFRGWLTRDPDKQNPLRITIQVLRFAATHKYPIRQCIVNNCTGNPSRLDYAKEDHGGPYTCEQVEDVKTFFRITVVIVATMAFFIPFILYQITMKYLGDHYAERNTQITCSTVSMPAIYSPSAFAVALCPLYEFFLHRFMRNRVPGMLTRMGIAACVTAILCGCVLVVDTITQAINPETVCMFATISNSTTHSYTPTPWLRVPSSLLTAVGVVIYGTAVVQFTYAQSPYNMRGTIVGLLLTALTIAFLVSYGIFIAWNNLKMNVEPSCDFYYLLFQFLCAVGGLTVLFIVAKWYKWRQRDDTEADSRERSTEELNSTVEFN